MIEISRRKLIKVGGLSLTGLLTSVACQTHKLEPQAEIAAATPPPPAAATPAPVPTDADGYPIKPALASDSLAGQDWKKYTIIRVQDPNKMTLSERKHQPVIQIEGAVKPAELFMAKINIGEVQHPMTPVHWIQWIEVYAEDQLLSRIEFTGFAPAAQVTLPLMTESSFQLRVIENCNQHGIWEAVQKIEV